MVTEAVESHKDGMPVSEPEHRKPREMRPEETMTTQEEDRSPQPEEEREERVPTDDVAELLAQLEELKRVLSSRVEAERSAEVSRAQAQEAKQTALLRQEILENLLRKGPALPIELAAATLSLPEEIQPVLERMVKEGLIEIRETGRGRLVTLTLQGRVEAQRWQSSAHVQRPAF